MLKLVFIIIGIICLFLAGFHVSHPRVDFFPLGWAFLAIGVLLPLP